MDIDSLIGVGARGRVLGDLKDDPIEADRIIVGHRTLVFKAQSLFNFLGTGFSPGRHCLGGLGELSVMLWPITIEHGLSLLNSLGFGQPQFTDQSVLEGSPQSFDPPLGLRRAGEDQGDPEFIERSAHFG